MRQCIITINIIFLQPQIQSYMVGWGSNETKKNLQILNKKIKFFILYWFQGSDLAIAVVQNSLLISDLAKILYVLFLHFPFFRCNSISRISNRSWSICLSVHRWSLLKIWNECETILIGLTGLTGLTRLTGQTGLN